MSRFSPRVCSVLSRRSLLPSRSRHLRGVEAPSSRGRDKVLGIRGDLKVLNVRIVPKDVAARQGGRVLRRNGNYTGLLQILFAIERLLRHVFAVHRILADVVDLLRRRQLLLLLLLAAHDRATLLTVAVLNVTRPDRRRATRRRGCLHALGRALRDGLEHVSRHIRRWTIVAAVLQTVHAIRITHEDRSALRSAAHYVPHAFAVFGAQALPGTVQRGRAALLIRRQGGAVQVGHAGPGHTGQLPTAKQTGHSFSLIGRVEALVVIRALKFDKELAEKEREREGRGREERKETDVSFRNIR